MDKKCSKKFGGKEIFSYLCQREILNKAYLKLIYFNKKHLIVRFRSWSRIFFVLLLRE